MEERITPVGLDVHKNSISVAVAEGGRCGEARFIGTIPNTAEALSKLAERLSREGGALRLCCGAGPCGYGVYRHLRGLGYVCAVLASSLIPRRAGDRVKTDRRDAVGLAKLIGLGSCRRSRFPTPITRSCATRCGPARRRCTPCAGLVSS